VELWAPTRLFEPCTTIQHNPTFLRRLKTKLKGSQEDHKDQRQREVSGSMLSTLVVETRSNKLISDYPSLPSHESPPPLGIIFGMERRALPLKKNTLTQLKGLVI